MAACARIYLPISISALTYAWPPVFCQPAYAKLIMLIELDHGVRRKIGLFIYSTGLPAFRRDSSLKRSVNTQRAREIRRGLENVKALRNLLMSSGDVGRQLKISICQHKSFSLLRN